MNLLNIVTFRKIEKMSSKQIFDEIVSFEKTILNSDNILAKLEYIRDLKDFYPQTSKDLQHVIIKSIFKLCKDSHDIVRLNALLCFSDDIKIPNEMIMQTIAKERPENFSFSSMPHIGVIETVLSDSLPEVRVAAINALANSEFKDGSIAYPIMKTASQMLNDNSNIVRQAAAIALTKCCAASNSLFPIEKAQIRLLIAMLEDSLPQNRHQTLQLIQRTLVDDVQHAKILITGMANAAAKFYEDRPLFIASAQEFGKNNWYFFHLSGLKNIHIIPQLIDTYSMETVIPFVALFAARKVHSFPLPKEILKYEDMIESIIEGCNYSTREEKPRPVDLNSMKELIDDNPLNEKFFLYECGRVDDAVSYLKSQNMQHAYFHENDEETQLPCINKIKVELLHPITHSQNPLKYDPNMNIFFDVVVKLSRPITQDLYVKIYPNPEIICQMQKTPNQTYKASPKVKLPFSIHTFRMQMEFGFMEDVDFFPIDEPHDVWLLQVG